MPNAISVWRLVNSASEKEVFPVAIYGLALEMLFIISTIFHTVSLLVRYERLLFNLLLNWFSYIFFFCSKWRYALHLSDRTMIFVFIAASYTPWIVLKELETSSWFLPGSMQSVFLGLVWMCAVLGVAYQIVFYEKYRHKGNSSVLSFNSPDI